MKRLLFLCLLVLNAACVPPRPPVTGGPTTPALTYARITIRDDISNEGVSVSATLHAWDGSAPVVGMLDAGRYVFITPSIGGATLHIAADGYVPLELDTTIARELGEARIKPVSKHVDPSTFSLSQLAAIRGAMWSVRWDGPLGPRPGKPDNIFATALLGCYSPADQQRGLEVYKSRGYTHVVTGPVVDSQGGYHGQFCENDWRTHFDDYLDLLQTEWDAGLIPVVFIHPDGWTLEQTKQLGPLLASPRAQKLIRVVVMTGWEPAHYEWSNATWIEYLKFSHEVLPNALQLIHTVSDADAPVGGDSLGDDGNPNQPPGISNAEAWSRITPYLHGWLVQLGACEDGPEPESQPSFQNFKDIFNPGFRGSYTDRFRHGYAGWPQSSAWGAGNPLRVYYAESCAFPSYWGNLPESVSQDYGDAAMGPNGDHADGYLDGGRVQVPLK